MYIDASLSNALAGRQGDKENAIGRSETGSNGRKTKYFSNVGPKQVSIQKNKSKSFYRVLRGKM